ncbi:MAG: hypothetical protein ACI4JC_05750 [Faecalibacterium sp.]
MTQTQNEAEFEFEWLLRQKYEFKILTLIAVLADNNLAYRGTLKDMCEFFGVKSGGSTNNKNIKAAIDKLEADGLLKQIKDGRTFTLTLSKKREQRKRVISIQKEWVEIAKGYKSEDNSISWMNLLKVWLYLIDNKKEVIKTSEITLELGMSTDSVKRAKKALERDIQAIISKRRTTISANGGYRCLGSSITVKAWLDE